MGEKQITSPLKWSGEGLNTWLQMLKHQDFESSLNNLNLTSEEKIALLNYFEALALIGIEYLNNEQIEDLEYEEEYGLDDFSEDVIIKKGKKVFHKATL